ncbi:MAG: amidohydrolase family protein [Gammaproteobacteria bacterium]|nr:amidohydrolase family protein [Gammaproteobacteria bacterium]
MKTVCFSGFRFSGKSVLFALSFALVSGTCLAKGVTLVIRGATVIDGTGGAPMENTAILVAEDRIKKIVPDDHPMVEGRISSDDTVVIDAAGKWVIPGFVQAHMHYWESGRLYASPGVFDLTQYRPEALERAWIRQRLPYTLSRFLCGGVTTAIDLGGPFWAVEVRELAAGAITAPRIAIVGRFIADIPLASNMWEPDDGAIVHASDPEHGRALVREYLSWGVENIKVGVLDDLNFESFMPTLEAIIDESHTAGVQVNFHTFDVEAAKAGMRAGVDILAHMPAAMLDDEFLALAREHDVLATTTLSIFKDSAQVLNDEVPLGLLGIEQECGDPEVIASWADLADIPLEERPPLHPFSTPELGFKEIAVANLKSIYDNGGIRIAMGSDAGNIGALHGAGVHQEFELMAEAGMSPMDILVAATKNAALVIDPEADFGILKKGNIADILILSADPTVDIHNTQTIEYVINKGVVFTHEELVTMSP